MRPPDIRGALVVYTVRLMQCKDITVDAFREAVDDSIQRWAILWGRPASDYSTAMVGDIARFLNAPEKLVRAKIRQLAKHGIIQGCGCGCRGDVRFNTPATSLHPATG